MKQIHLTTKIFNTYRTALCCILLLLSGVTRSQDFTWMSGANVAGQPGIYGTLGVPASINEPGSRESSVSWKDASGNLWLFGGLGYDASSNYGFLSDLWKYNVTNNQWT